MINKFLQSTLKNMVKGGEWGMGLNFEEVKQ